jgi:hypothetical protein
VRHIVVSEIALPFKPLGSGDKSGDDGATDDGRAQQ